MSDSPTDRNQERQTAADPVPVLRLEQEWERLAGGVLRERFAGWRERQPALRPFADPEQLLRFLRGPAASGCKDDVMRGLLALAREEPDAARVVLQALLPGLKRLAARVLRGADEREQLWELLLAFAWERIRSYPLERRPRRIAANLLLDTLRQTLRELRRERRRYAGAAFAPPAASTGTGGAPDVEVVLARAVSAGAISALEARLILAVRLERCSLAEAAARERLAYNVARVRLQRAERRLLLYLGQPPVPRRRPRRPFSSARAAGADEAGDAGGVDQTKVLKEVNRARDARAGSEQA